MHRLQTELQANASSVETGLGSRNHGYLGLVKVESEHSEIPNALPFVAPEHSPALNMPDDSTSIQALELKDQHVKRKDLT